MDPFEQAQGEALDAVRVALEAEHLITCLQRTLAALSEGRLLVHPGRVLLHVTRNADSAVARSRGGGAGGGR